MAREQWAILKKKNTNEMKPQNRSSDDDADSLLKAWKNAVW